ncbi:hypothetical protein [Roseibium sediminicola]|uniref:Secreted protein n=1 Tax=Roseibium sediminicola TaxID=2933272 RepID=A0ABT0GY14_9HYPH|nr:hypothetical protein [Roseibium sp. CAU 1639]MCK7613708.1 hypothetical protein [Roseibium sp. CAU 1639]
MTKDLICLMTALLLSVAPAWADRGKGERATSDTYYWTRNLTVDHQCDGIGAPRTDCSKTGRFIVVVSVEAPGGGIFCSSGKKPRQIAYQILERADGEWDALLTVDGTQIRAMTAYSYFGNSHPPNGFVVALLGEDGSEVLVYRDGETNWLKQGEIRYNPCT